MNISYGSAHNIVTECLGMSRICARWIPHNLTPEQKQKSVDLSKENLQQLEREGQAFLNRIVTGDETWVYQ
jgi:histone-lysine N-methyltransferase SETMAR